MELYQRNDEHKHNNECFMLLMKRYDWIRPFKPNPEKAPWHIQAELTTRIGYGIYLNFWPHVAKAQMEGEGSIEGWDKIRSMISRAIDDCDDIGDDFMVTE